jgi:hypothetical protein
MAANNDHTGKCFTFTEARIAAVIRRVVDDGDATDADASGRRTWRDDGCRGLQLVVTLKTGTAVFYFVGKVGRESRSPSPWRRWRDDARRSS